MLRNVKELFFYYIVNIFTDSITLFLKLYIYIRILIFLDILDKQLTELNNFGKVFGLFT